MDKSCFERTIYGSEMMWRKTVIRVLSVETLREAPPWFKGAVPELEHVRLSVQLNAMNGGLYPSWSLTSIRIIKNTQFQEHTHLCLQRKSGVFDVGYAAYAAKVAAKRRNLM